jgi:phenylacetate-coenzyme A ligase PaaK-like adenylate-forming protein
MPAGEVPAMFEPEAESLSAEQMAGLQTERLRGLVDRLLAAGGLQGTRLKDAGVHAGAEVNLATLHLLPTTSKGDLWDAYPFGLLAVSTMRTATACSLAALASTRAPSSSARLWSQCPAE